MQSRQERVERDASQIRFRHRLISTVPTDTATAWLTLTSAGSLATAASIFFLPR